jgi:hypothetical protein
MKIALVIVGVVAVAFVAIEVVLLKVSRYRLTHGDGKERAFRKGVGAKGTTAKP